MTKMRAIAAILGLVLSGCGGGGTADGPDGPMVLDPNLERAELDALADDLADLDFTMDLPAGGEAVYDGYAGLTAASAGQETLFVTGRVALTARFGSGTIAGRIDRFAASGGAGVAGDIALQDGQVGITGFTGDLDGTFRAWGRDHQVAGTATGAFLGADAAGLAGAVDATLSGGGTLSGEIWARR
jgi:hypothetical protein